MSAAVGYKVRIHIQPNRVSVHWLRPVQSAGINTGRTAHYALRITSGREHDTHAYHIIACNCSTSSFHIRSRFCARNSSVKRAHRSMFSGLTKSIATLIQSDRLHTYCCFQRSVPRLLKSRTYLVRAPSWDKYCLALPLKYAVTPYASFRV